MANSNDNTNTDTTGTGLFQRIAFWLVPKRKEQQDAAPAANETAQQAKDRLDREREDRELMQIDEAERAVKRSIASGVAVGAIGLIGYPLCIAGIGHTLLFLSVLMAGAAFMCGFFIGILFGIPKRNMAQGDRYNMNNSLVEIADWLTKIIVGLGLVNITAIPGQLQSIGQFVAAGSNSSRSLEVFTICVIVYFSVLGLYNGYNFMRLVLSLKYVDADDDVNKQLKEVKTELIQAKDEKMELEKKSEQLLQEVNKPKMNNDAVKKEAINRSGPTAPPDHQFVDQMLERARQKMADGMAINDNDPQKDMWGGLPERNFRRLRATVKERTKGLYHIRLRVESTDPSNHPLDDDDVVLFALHNTWNPATRLMNVENGAAELELFSYGSFTVGALVDKANTELELDLAELPGVSEQFKNT